VPGENLTRAEAQERSSLVATESYDIALDLTTGPEVFRSTSNVVFTATPGASTFIDAITRMVHSVTLNGVELDAAAIADGTRIQLDGLAERNELTSSPTTSTRTPARACTASSTRSTARCTITDCP